MKHINAICKVTFDFNAFLNTIANLKLIEKPNTPSLLKVREANKELSTSDNRVIYFDFKSNKILIDYWPTKQFAIDGPDKYLAELTNKVLGTNLDQATAHNVLVDMWTF